MANLPEGASPSLVAVAPATFQFSQLSLILTICYFGYFFMLFFIGLTEKPKELPESIHKSVLKRHKASSATAVPAE
jgi:ubiquinol-cytochrome c reductase cytochrome b subunit